MHQHLTLSFLSHLRPCLHLRLQGGVHQGLLLPNSCCRHLPRPHLGLHRQTATRVIWRNTDRKGVREHVRWCKVQLASRVRTRLFSHMKQPTCPCCLSPLPHCCEHRLRAGLSPNIPLVNTIKSSRSCIPQVINILKSPRPHPLSTPMHLASRSRIAQSHAGHAPHKMPSNRSSETKLGWAMGAMSCGSHICGSPKKLVRIQCEVLTIRSTPVTHFQAKPQCQALVAHTHTHGFNAEPPNHPFQVYYAKATLARLQGLAHTGTKVHKGEVGGTNTSC